MNQSASRPARDGNAYCMSQPNVGARITSHPPSGAASVAVVTSSRTNLAEDELQDGLMHVIQADATAMAATDVVSVVSTRYQLCGPRLLTKRIGSATAPIACIDRPEPLLHRLAVIASNPTSQIDHKITCNTLDCSCRPRLPKRAGNVSGA